MDLSLPKLKKPRPDLKLLLAILIRSYIMPITSHHDRCHHNVSSSMKWMNEWIIRNWYKLHQTRLHAAFKALNGSSTTNAHTQHGRGPFCLDRVVEKLILIPKTSRKSSQIHKVQFLNLFLVNFSIISYSFIFVHSFLSVLDFRTFRTSLLVISEVPGVQIRSLGNHSLSIDIFLVLLATCKIQKKKRKNIENTCQNAKNWVDWGISLFEKFAAL